MGNKTKLKDALKWRYLDSWFHRHIGSAIAHPKNFLFCAKYPFWKVRNAIDGRFCGYSFTVLDLIPKGWRKALGGHLTTDVAKALKEDGIPRWKWGKKVFVQEVKEKYGTLRIYAAATEKVQNILSEYEARSACTCIECGKPALYITRGYILPLCDECLEKKGKTSKDADEIKKEEKDE